MEESIRNKELIETISIQKSEFNRYKARFKDLVGAHKCLLKEKEVLEKSLKTFSLSTPPKRNDELTPLSHQTSNNYEPVPDSNDESVEQLKCQLTTLMNSLATLSEEKCRMEAGFQADKKQMRAEKKELEKTIKDMESRLEHETRAHLSEMENFKSKLIIERHQREKEHNDHGVMIRELQKVVSEERAKREKAETNAQSVREELKVREEAWSEAKKEARDASSHLEGLKERLRDKKDSCGATAVRLKEELSLAKEQLMASNRKEHEKVEAAERRSRELAAIHEERVANLEGRLAELSLTVGNYDRLRQSDQDAITRLRERIAQLEREKPLTQTQSDSHKLCQDEYDELKREFDNYKCQYDMSQRTDSPSFRSGMIAEEELKSQVKKLKARIRELHAQIDEKQLLHKKEIDALQKAVLNEKKLSREKLSQVEGEWRGKLGSLETQVTKQRQRAMEIVAEREQKLSELRASLLPSSLSTDRQGEEAPIVLHYSEEVARRDVELTRLRKEKHKLEGLLRESERRIAQMTAKEEALSEALSYQVDRFVQGQTREGANLEYLKNVVLSFLVTNDHASKSHMLNAIATVLQFTDSEKARISQQSWWQKSSHT